MIRALVALIIGAVVTFGLFAFMAFLVSFDDDRLQKSKKTPSLVINPDRLETKTRTKTRFKPKPPPPDAPPPPAAAQPETNDSNIGLIFELPSVNIGGINAGLSGPVAGTGMMKDGDATPIIRIEPRYPIKAARDGKEGYVILSFTINKIGGVEDVKVLEAKPKRLFDKEARRALRRWRYKPKMVDGKPQRQTGQTVRLDFSLEKQRRR